MVASSEIRFQRKSTSRRGSLDILATILSLLKKEPITKTAIVYNSNLNFIRLNRYLTMLKNMGYIDVTSMRGKKVFQLTSDGNKFLADYCRHKRFTLSESAAHIP